eukprot:TRINITY_DN15882_c0_g1_i8.p1 TRINITY_DN15882_c0_g1~~TRINITY_DN15882_c0_g1_i8.p1  ORF type:complete len:419 (+),score=137.06 TRINITY_DN15882_c0_g1_i8:82-1338(+)
MPPSSIFFFFLMIRRPPRSTLSSSSAASDVYKRQSQMFSVSEFKSTIFDTFVDKADMLVEQLSKHVDTHANDKKDNNGGIDLQDYFFKYTMDTFGKIAFNAEFGTMEGKSNDYGEAFDGAHEDWIAYARSAAIFSNVIDTLSMKNKIRQAVESLMGHFSPTLRSFTRHMATLKRYTVQVIANRRGSEPAGSLDILGLFMESSAQQETPFTEQYLTDVVLNMIIAGRDTTACLLSWSFYLLGHNPQVIDRLRDQTKDLDCNDYEQVRKHSYLSALLHEVGRLYPPVPTDNKLAMQDDILPNGLRIHAGTQVGFAPYVQGRDPDLWDEPLEFRPERWLQDGKFKPPSLFEYSVFQAGPRVCLGMNFALTEASVVLTKLLNNFEFELVSTAPKLPDTGKATMSIKGPLMVKLKPRNLPQGI